MFEMSVEQLSVCVVLSLVLFSGRSSSQEIHLQRQAYQVSEDVSLRNRVLKVCVEGISLDDESYIVQIKTENASFNAATDGIDYIGIDKELTLNGPGEDTQCTCVQVLEDEEPEQEERIGLRISGSPLITRDSVNAIIRDNDGISFRFIGDSPRVVDNNVTFELQFDLNVISATCEVLNHGSVDCSNGLAQFSLLPEIPTLFQPVIITEGPQGEIETSQDRIRRFRTSGSHGRCSVHLINDGIYHDPLTGETKIEWVWTGPGAEGRTYCILDGVQRLGQCASPYVLSGLADGPHVLRILVRRGQCRGPFARRSRTFRFNIPTF